MKKLGRTEMISIEQNKKKKNSYKLKMPYIKKFKLFDF